jgi:hypothetical protein
MGGPALWGALHSSFDSASTPVGRLLELIHGLGEGARGAKPWYKKGNSQFAVSLLSAALSPDSFQIKPLESTPVDIGAPRPVLVIDCLLVISVDNMPPPDCICVAGYAFNFPADPVK